MAGRLTPGCVPRPLSPQGDDLDAKIRKTEKELRALRKTLDHLTDRNTRYRKNVTKVRPGGGEGVRRARC